MNVSMRRLVATALFVIGTCAAQMAAARDPRYPDWPCQQLKVPQISLASVWTGPSLDGLDKTQAADSKQADLVARLAARRTPMDDARKLIGSFISGSAAEKQDKAKTLFAALFDTLNAQRSEVMVGIERFSRKQKGFAADIRSEMQTMRDLQDANGDPAQVDALAKRLEWKTRIFDDRRKSTTYVCEVPTIIEKRLYDLARAIQEAAQ